MAVTRLGVMDLSILAMERSGRPMHFGVFGRLDAAPLRAADGSLRLDDLRTHLDARLHRAGRLRQRVRAVPLGLARPVWEDDPHFDIADHVRAHVLPSPGDAAAQRAWCAELQTEPMDRARPMWDLLLADGMDDGSVGFVVRLHHAYADGVAAVEIATALLDLVPDAPVEAARPWSPSRRPRPDQLVVGALRDDVAAFPRLVRRAPALVGALPSLAAMARPGILASHRAGGQTRFGGSRLSWVGADLEEVGAVRAALGGKVNDVLLAAVAGGFRRVLLARGEPVDRTNLRAVCPVNVRTQPARGEFGNRTSAFFAPLPVDTDDPVERLARVTAETAMVKGRGLAAGVDALLALGDALPPAVMTRAAGLLHHQPLFNALVTNVMGAPIPLYLMGSRILEIFPLPPLIARNIPLAVAALSYDGRLTIGLHTDATALPEADALAAGTRAELDALLELARQGAATAVS